MTDFTKTNYLKDLQEQYDSEKNKNKKLKIFRQILKLQEQLKNKPRMSNSKEKEDLVKTATSITLEQTDGTKKRYEQIYSPKFGMCQFITYNKATLGYEYTLSVKDENKGIMYMPPCEEDSGVSEDVVLFPTEPEDYISFVNLYDEIDKYVVKYLDIDPEKRKLANYLIILDWLIDGLNTIPILRFLGGSGNGKTRAVTTYGHIAYLPTLIASPNAANIFRILTNYTDATLVINEDMDLSNKAVKNSENKESVRAIILNGWERKFKVPRHNNTTGKDEYFSPFGLKIMSSYYATSFSAYENRCLNIDVWETERNDIIINTDVKFLKDALHIRNMLLDFKLKNANADFSKYNAMTFKDFGSNVSRRVCQATAPLMRLELFEPTIREYLLSLAMQRNLDEISRNVGTDEGKFFKLYLDILIETCDKDITTNRIKELLPEFYKDWRMDTINNRFKQLGFEIQKKKPDRGRINYHIIFDKKTIFKLIQKYVLPEDRTDDDGHTLNDQIESISTVSEENQQENDQNQEKHGKHENGFQQRRID